MSGSELEPILIFPDPPPPDVAQTIDLAGYPLEGGGFGRDGGAPGAGRRLGRRDRRGRP